MEKSNLIVEYIKGKNTKDTDTRTNFADVLVMYLGAELNKVYYPKVVDEQGNKVKDNRGLDVKSDVEHYLHCFSELGTSKIVKVVTSQKLLGIKHMSVYSVKGRGYDIKNANLLFIDKDGTVNGIQ